MQENTIITNKEFTYMNYICPVCGYDGLENPPYDDNGNKSYDICVSCNFEYGFSEDNDVDLGYSVTPDEMRPAAFQLYRKKWIEDGAIVGQPILYPERFQENGKVKREVLLKQLQRLNLQLDNLEFI